VEQVLFSKTDASRALNLSIRTLEGLIRRGELRTRRIGRRVLISRTEINKFAELSTLTENDKSNS